MKRYSVLYPTMLTRILFEYLSQIAKKSKILLDYPSMGLKQKFKEKNISKVCDTVPLNISKTLLKYCVVL